jgi:ParB family chromosome partitioning protein
MDKHTPSPESTIKHKKLALGRGLSALIPDAGPTFEPEDGFFLCDIDLIRPNRFQPRHQFAEEELAELTGSIREQGVLQPLIVRKSDPGFELIAGERRLRAARRAGLSQVPVVLKTVSDDQLLELSLVENIQRENLNPIEEAEAYHRLIEQLPEEVKASIVKGGLSMGHARALLGAENGAQQLAAWRAVIARGLSVRETEDLVRRLKAEKKKPRGSMHGSEAVHLASLSEDLSRHLGTKVTIRKSGRQGRVEIEFYGNDDLDRLITRLRQIKL